MGWSADIMRTDPLSDAYQRKVGRAKSALAGDSGLRSIAASLDTAMRTTLNATGANNAPSSKPAKSTPAFTTPS